MKKVLFCLLLGLFSSLFAGLAQPLAGTDDLGRTLLQNNDIGNPKPNRQIGLFYFLWVGDNTAENYWDLSEIIANHPEVLDDYDNEYWGTPAYYPGGRSVFHFWGQPVYGYYRSDDYWVALRSIQLLTDAMVDFLVIDATNTLIYEKQADVLMKAMDAVREQGKNPPGIVFYTNTESGKTMEKVYRAFYKEGAPYYHPGCWYQLDGKPLIIGITKEAKGTDYEQFFTFRESQWPNEEPKVNGWPWISFTRPQQVFYNSRGEKEIISVSVAQHPNWLAGMSGSAFYGNRDNWGRSYRNNSHGTPATDLPYGYNFQEQWDYALTQNTPFIFVTGWNEWVAGRWASTDGNPKHSWFCDLASPEYSRDAEPSLTAGLKDNYYMQMVNNIRRYKGIETIPNPGATKKIRKFDHWKDVLPEYTDYTGDTSPRNHPGAQSKPATTYTNNTGRNDFHIMKVARDKQNIYFYAETVDNLTPCQGDNWMRLYIDPDRDSKTGWKGYDYRIIEGKTLQRYENGSWKDVCKIDSRVEKNKLMISVPRKEAGLSGSVDMEFKWSDNMQDDDPLDWYVNGDAAPGGRFNYVYTTKK